MYFGCKIAIRFINAVQVRHFREIKQAAKWLMFPVTSVCSDRRSFSRLRSLF